MKKKIASFLNSLGDVKHGHRKHLYKACIENFFHRKNTRLSVVGTREEFEKYLQRIQKSQLVRDFYKMVLDQYHAWEKKSTAKESSLPEVLSKEEIEHLLSLVTKPSDYLMLTLAYGAGLKVSELVKIQVSHIDIDKNTIVIFSKGERRDVPLPLRIKEQLVDFIESKGEEEYLFPGRKGNMLTPRSVQYVFNKYLKRSQITKKISINVLRHSFAVHLLDQGVDIHYVQRLLGHKNSRTTQVYKKLSKAPLENIVSPFK